MSECRDQRFENMLHAYELGMLDDADREALEIHLLECDHCYARLMEMKQEMLIMQSDPDARKTITDIIEQGDPDSVVESGDSTRRPLWQRMMPTLVAVAALLVFLILKPWHLEFRTSEEAIAAKNRMAVMYFENLAQRDDPDRMGEIAANLLMTDLSESSYLTVLSGQRLYDILKAMGREGEKIIDRDIATEVAQQAEAKWMILGYILQVEPKLVVTTQLVDVETDQVMASQQVTGQDGEDIFALVDQLTVGIKTDLALPTDALREEDRFIADVTTHSPEAYRHYLTGLDYLSQYYYLEAKESFHRALDVDSTFAMAYYYLTTHEDNSLIEKAVQYMDKTTRREQWYIKILDMQLKGNQGQALKYLQDLLRHYPDEKEALFMLGSTEYGLGNNETAIELFTRILKLDPLHKLTHNHLAFAYYDNGDFDKAIQANDTYMSLAPNEANPYDSRAMILARHGRIDDAVLFYKKALDIKPDYNTSWLGLGRLYVFTREYDKARECFDRLIASPEQLPRTIGRKNLAEMLLFQGRYREALRALEDGIAADLSEEISPTWLNNTAIKYRLMSLIYIDRGEYELALESFRGYADIATTHFPNYHNSYLHEYAIILAHCGKFRQADQIVDSLKDYLYHRGQTDVLYLSAAGIVAFIKGKPNQAISYLDKIKQERLLYRIEYWHARVCLATGNDSRALNILESHRYDYPALKTGNMLLTSRYYYTLGTAYEKVGYRQRAIEAYEEFLDQWKDADDDIAVLRDARSRLKSLRDQQ